MRRQLKQFAELAVASSGAPQLSLRARRSRTLILAYHDIVPNDSEVVGDASLHLPQAQFAAQLDALAHTHEIVPLEAALAQHGLRRSRPHAAITFDDAYHGAVTAGVAELANRELPATIFVPPGLLGGREFWWDVLAPAHGGALDSAVRTRALETLAGKGDAILRDASRDTPLRTLPPHVRSASEDELARAAAVSGITFGSHSWSHPNLAALSASELGEELRSPQSWLRERFEHVLPYLSYPYGLFSSQVQEAARAAGYTAALRIDGGWVGDAFDPFAVPRMDVPSGVSHAGFRLRVAGVFS